MLAAELHIRLASTKRVASTHTDLLLSECNLVFTDNQEPNLLAY